MRTIFKASTILLVLVLLAPQQGAHAQCDTAGLTDGPLEDSSGPIDFDAEFVNGACNAGGDMCPQARAQDMLDACVSSMDLYRSFGFSDAYQTTLPEYNIVVHDITDAGILGSAHPDCVEMDAPSFDCDVDGRPITETMLHELFHTIQRRYMCAVNDCDTEYIGSTFGKWVAEGTAAFCQDHLFNNIDNPADGYNSGFMGRVSGGFNSSATRLPDLSYKAALWWKYCAEQFGSVAVEPQRGIDFMVQFWQTIESNGSSDSFTALRDTFSDLGAGSLEKVWLDYAICNYVHPFDVSQLPNPTRYGYVDSTQSGGNYPTVTPAAVVLPVVNAPGNVADFAAQYFEANVNPTTQACRAVGFRGSSVETLGWAIVGVTPGGKAVGLSKHQGKEFGRSILVSPFEPITRFAGIVAGLGTAANFNYWFDSGAIELSIVRPTFSRQAFAGQFNAPGRFLVRLYVNGPANLKPPGVGNRSILGLNAEDFAVTVNGVAATILSTGYVGGEYWLTVQAPNQVSNGLYDLLVSMCDNTVTARSGNSVLYANITLNHVIVVDKSGSMSDPAANPKLDAAKIAAALYVDAVSDNDRVGVVAFDGDGVNCNIVPGSLVREALATANLAQRNDCKADIAGLTPGGKTSIGDGTWEAQDQLDLFPADTEIHTMILLSDGMENEGRKWNVNAGCASSTSRIAPTDTIVNSIAFGPDSDQTLMMQIASDTDGDYTYVDVDEGATAGATGLSMINELSDTYMYGLQKARKLERIFYQTGGIAGGGSANVDINLTETEVRNATFFFSVDNPAANLKVDLFDPAHNPVGPPGAQVYATSSHVAFHLAGPLATGTWHAVLKSDVAVEFIAGLLGQQRQGAQLALGLSQVLPMDSATAGPEPPYRQGIPVNILATLTDRSGPIEDAKVEVTVIKPDGKIACSSGLMFDDGAHGDGAESDGVYGLVFTETAQGSRGGVFNDDPDNPPPPGEHGSYRVLVAASGRNHAQQTFARWASTGFHVFSSQRDRDQDGLPDGWELYYGTNVSQQDAAADLDNDGLRHTEEFHYGTHPLDSDTDNDGETDGSEILHGRCPTDPSDGVLPPPIDVEVIADMGDEGKAPLDPQANLLRFPVHSSYQGMRIFRSADVPAPLVLFKTLMGADLHRGLYYDGGAQRNHTYFYRFQALGASGAETRFSPIVSGMPPTILGDLNFNGPIDLADLAIFQRCFRGDGVIILAVCKDADLDGDNDVGLTDFVKLKNTFTGPR